MDILTLILIILTSISVWYHFKKKLSYFKNHGVPYAPGLPLFGNMTSVIFRVKHISEMIRDIYKANPGAKYVGAFNFGQPAIILRDPELIKYITIKNFESFQNHSMTVSKDLDPLMGNGLFHIKGESWRKIRNLLNPAFTSSKLKSMLKLMIDCSENFNAHVSKLTNNQRKDVATKDLFTKYTADVIATCAFGVTIDSLKIPNNDFYVLANKNAIFEGLFMWKFYMACAIPRLMKLFNMRVINEDFARLFKDTLRNVIETRDREKINRPDMIQLMMNARSTDKKDVNVDIDAIIAQALIIFIGGFDTMSTQMCIIAHELAVNPDIQKKLQNEIDKVRKEANGEISYEAIQEMPHLDAVFNESLRRHTETVILDRLCEKPFELPPALPGGKPFTILPGMMVWISGKSIHLDPKYYDNPEKFNPERYYQKKIKINDEFNLGFGIGPRACIGFRFATLGIKVLFFHLLSEYNLVANGKTKLPIIQCKSSMNIKPRGGFCLAIERRNKLE